MAEIVRMPKLSDTMTEGVVAEWHKKVGDEVKSGELLAEIETDKATMEFESFQDGVLLHIGVEKGKSAPVDSILAILGEKGEDVDKIIKEEKEKSEKEKDDKSSEKSESKKSDDSDKKEKGEEKPEKSESKPAAKEQRKSEIASAPAPLGSNGEDRVKASPLARKMASEKGIDLNVLRGTGDAGRVVKRDIERYGGSKVSGIESHDDYEISQMRKTIAKRLAESKFTAPHFYLTIDLDMDQAVAARQSINKAIEPAKISY